MDKYNSSAEVNESSAEATEANEQGMLSRVGGYIARDVGKAVDWLTETPEERAERKAEEKRVADEKQAEEDRKKKEEEDAKKAEEERLAKLQESYILHTAMIRCSYALRESFVVVPVSHGEFIQGIPQLNIGDSVPIVNIRSFGICNSPLNPAVQAAAKKIIEEVNSMEKTFSEKVMSIFTWNSDKNLELDAGDESLIAQCVGPCTPIIATEWIDGKEDVLVDGKPALLGRCKLMCKYNGEITMFTSGQYE